MSLPFTIDPFFDVFARYNVATWPVVVVLWVVALVTLVAIVRAHGERSHQIAAAVLVVLWLKGDRQARDQ